MVGWGNRERSAAKRFGLPRDSDFESAERGIVRDRPHQRLIPGAGAWIATMNNDLLTALATLRSDPEDGQALALLAGLQPGDVSATERDSVQVALAAERAWHTDRENV